MTTPATTNTQASPSRPLTNTIYALVFALWIALVLIACIYPDSMIVIAIGYTGLLPFLLGAIWLSRLNDRYGISSRVSSWLGRILITWALFGYAIYAQKWAAATINEIFHIDANHLGITYLVVAALFAPFELLYQDNIMAYGLLLIIAVGNFQALWLILRLLGDTAHDKIPTVRIVIISILTLMLGAFFFTIGSNIARDKAMLIKTFAVWADFNTSHPCSDDWAPTVDSLVFLEGGKVLTYQKSAKDEQFKFQSCDYKKAFHQPSSPLTEPPGHPHPADHTASS
ncbi:hypothetical protein [Pseudomonas xantholysinigenes]|uniref:Uncharacterized protein n=1 Tax=Pseudomonas xantholysinigenes TaxID=2745490 RepID=A0A9E6PS43_9PSED|nr:hypothetical protein [Pseudomonas xantholysinigenes]QXI36572.1 hypothetical protein HU772_014550 [Pseudomonas xantholysinigenes]